MNFVSLSSQRCCLLMKNIRLYFKVISVKSVRKTKSRIPAYLPKLPLGRPIIVCSDTHPTNHYENMKIVFSWGIIYFHISSPRMIKNDGRLSPSFLKHYRNKRTTSKAEKMASINNIVERALLISYTVNSRRGAFTPVVYYVCKAHILWLFPSPSLHADGRNIFRVGRLGGEAWQSRDNVSAMLYSN